MQKPAFNFRSSTDALKARRILSEHGIYSVYGKRIVPSAGCAHILKLSSGTEKAAEILKSNNISYFSDGGEEL